MSMSYCTSKILIKILYLYKHKRNIQDINIVKILDIKLSLVVLLSNIFTLLISWLFLLWCLYKSTILMRILDVQYDIDIIASLSFVNSNGIPVMYAVF